MLSNSIIGSSTQASHYFMGHDNYYTKGDAMAKERSEWWGKGSVALELSGQVDEKTFSDLLKGKMPDGEQLGLKMNNDEIKHRPGFDLTFSVPKSVSIAALLGADPRIFEAIKKASDKALSLVERSCAQARTTKEGKTIYENSKNLVVAKFLHDLSREADPQLHVHCVVMNMTQRSDGKWRSLASQLGDYSTKATREINGFIERVRHHEHYFGMAFDAELAFELKKLGYNIIKPERGENKNAAFQIEGISKKTIEIYSRRSKQIDQYMKSYGFSGAKAAAVATLKTRQAKQNISRETIQSLWESMSEANGIGAFDEAKKCVGRSLANLQTQKNIPFHDKPLENNHGASDTAVQYAINYLSETQIVLKEMDILNIALQYGVGESININTIFHAIKDFKIKGGLIPLEGNLKGENNNSFYSDNLFTTKTQINYEREILSLTKTVTKNASPLIATQKVEAYLSHPTLKELSTEQKQAMRILFSNINKIGILDGSVASGKTYLIQPMMALAKAGGYQTVLLTASKAHNEALKASFTKKPTTFSEWLKNLFSQSQYATVSSFLKKPDNYIDVSPLIKRKAIAFIDNAHLISAKQWHDLSVLAKKTNLHIMAMGDQKSLQNFQAGTPYTQMLDNGVVYATLTKNYSTQNKDIKDALSDTLSKNIEKAFEKVHDRIFSVENKEERLNIMAERYALLSEKEKEHTLLLMPSKAQCEEINEIVREALKKNNALHKTGIFAELLIPKSLSEAAYSYVKNYEKGQWVRFNEDYRSLKVNRGDYLKILSIDSKSNTVLLENEKGEKINWAPLKTGGFSGKVEVFESKTRELVVGETINWRRTDKDLGFYNGERLRITGIQGNQISVKRDNEKIQTISLNAISARHFDYGYAFTAYQKSHLQIENVIAYQASFSRQSHQRLFYKILGQAKKNAWIYTENKEVLLKNLQQHTGDKITAIDALLGKENINQIHELVLLEKAVLATLLKAKEASQLISEENTPEVIAKNAVQYAIAHLAEREAAFEHKQVMSIALKFALGNASIQDIQGAVEEAEKNGNLIKGIYSQDGTHWTTREAIEMEREILKLASNNKILSQIASKEKIAAYIKEINPKAEHAQAISEITHHTGAILNIQGHAGAGKTTLLKYIVPVLKEENFELLCLAPTHSAVKELKARGLTAQTVESFLAQNRPLLNSTNDQSSLDNYTLKKNYQLIIAVDESSMVSNRRMRDFLQIAENMEARSWIIGDKKQHPAIESGKPATLLERAGVKTLYLTDIERQKDAKLLKAVKETYQQDFAQAFKTLEKNIIEIGKQEANKNESATKENIKNNPNNQSFFDDRGKRLAAIRDTYIKLASDERAQTLIITFGNEDRMMINALIRQGMAKNNEFSGNEILTPVLISKDMTIIEKSLAQNYQIGDKLRFGQADKILGIEKNDYLTVSQIHVENNLLTLSKPNGEKIVFQPQSQRFPIEVYHSEERKLQAGDYIRWTRSDKETGFLSPEVLRVEKIEQGKNTKLHLQPVKITAEGWGLDGPPLFIDTQNKRNQHWDYAYVMTGYSAQGRTIKNVIINAESYRKNLTNEASFLVGITRAVQNLIIYTDDKNKLLKKIHENTREKTSALETIGKLQSLEKSLPRKNQDEKSKQNNKSAQNEIVTARTVSKNTSISQSSPALHKFDAAIITQALHENAEIVVERIMGTPKERTGQQYRYGSKQGSLIVTMKGDKQGFWHDFQTGEGGNLLHLIAKQSGLNIKKDFQRILAEGVKLLGQPESFMRENYQKLENKIAYKNEKPVLTDKQKNSIKYAQKLARESITIKNTLAEKYLKEHRHIKLDKFPDSIRFHPAIYSERNKSIHPALLVVAKDVQGKVKAVQAIYLDEKTANKASNVEIVKQTWGLPSSGATVNLDGNPQKDAPVFIAEGPETGLSLYAALGKAHVKITLGKSNFKNIYTALAEKNIVLCLDNDGKAEEEKLTVKEFAEKFFPLNKNIWVAKAESVNKDYNDVLKEEGIAAIRKNIENAILHDDFINQTKSGINLRSEILKDLNFDQQKLFELDSTVIKQAQQNTEGMKATTKKNLGQAIDKIAAQITRSGKEHAFINDISLDKERLPKELSNSPSNLEKIKIAESKKIPEKVLSIDKEIEI